MVLLKVPSKRCIVGTKMLTSVTAAIGNTVLVRVDVSMNLNVEKSPNFV